MDRVTTTRHALRQRHLQTHPVAYLPVTRLARNIYHRGQWNPVRGACALSNDTDTDHHLDPSPVMGFGDFETICKKSALPLCSIIGPPSPITGKVGIEPTCYARSVEFANTIIFSAATDFMHILALGLTAVMVLHVRSKFTAVGTFIMIPSGLSRLESTIQSRTVNS